ncbi:MAG: PKD domain-containing protein, partial [Bacteroidota bacterium]
AGWGSGNHTFSFTAATANTPAYITVTGTGAFIALPKAYNGGEYQNGPPTTNGSVTYEVLSYVSAGGVETMVITLDIGGGTFWTFTLVH